MYVGKYFLIEGNPDVPYKPYESDEDCKEKLERWIKRYFKTFNILSTEFSNLCTEDYKLRTIKIWFEYLKEECQ